ncbi:MAG: PTPA-CTERM sorting domain-containing protein [Leptolyngbya sp. SIO3F4]|nr:PTPA-CTERM sorting domain-containing protein [Leptolyngbya sp. SIO3F4]
MKGIAIKFAIAANVVAGVVAMDISTANAAGFTGNYAPTNWEFFDNAGGSIDLSGTPGTIELTGGNSSASGITAYTIEAVTDGNFIFDWSYATSDLFPVFDPFVVITDTIVSLTDDRGPALQSGTFSQFVTAGTIIGWGISTTDGLSGPALVNISNFSGPEQIPTPALLPGLLAMGGVVLRRKKAQVLEEN